MNRNKKVILLYIILIIFELIGFINGFGELKFKMFLYYTELSNLILLISCIIELILLLKENKKKNKFFDILNYSSILGVCNTFLIVIFLLIPKNSFNFSYYLFSGSMLFHHLFCPILGFITFLISNKKFNKKDIIYSLIFTLSYSIIMLLLNIFKVLEGPYYFFMVYENTMLQNVFYIVLLIIYLYILSYGLYKIKKQ